MAIETNSYQGDFEVPAAMEQEQNSFQKETTDEPLGTAFSTPQEPVAPVQQEAPAQVEDPQERNFRALSDSVEQLKAERESERREHQLQIDMYRANQVQRPQEIQRPKQLFDGMEDSEIPNVGEFRKAWAERERAYNDRIEELQERATHPDFAEVVTKYGKHLADTDPSFLDALNLATNKSQYAYQQAKKEQRLQELEALVKAPPVIPQKSVTAQRIVENARKPGTLAQAGGQSALSQADYFATMSDQDFMKMASKYQEGI